MGDGSCNIPPCDVRCAWASTITRRRRCRVRQRRHGHGAAVAPRRRRQLNFDTQLLTSDLENVTRACLREGIEDAVRRSGRRRAAVLLRSRHRERPRRLPRDVRRKRLQRRRLADRGTGATRTAQGTSPRSRSSSTAATAGGSGPCPPSNNMHASLREGLSILTRQPFVAGVDGGGRQRRLHGVGLQCARRRRRRHPRARLGRGHLRLRRSGPRRVGPASAVQVARLAHALAAEREAGDRYRHAPPPSRVVCRAGCRVPLVAAPRAHRQAARRRGGGDVSARCSGATA